MARTALIGHTGFVGGTLARASGWDATFNSSNIADIAGQSFDLLVCAGVSAVKWVANKEPEADEADSARLTNALAQASVRELILISTIDVYPDPAANHPYDRHRLDLERWAAARFPLLRVIRLPALFGAGLRKNAIFDLLHGKMLASINPAGRFQWYPSTAYGPTSRQRAKTTSIWSTFFLSPSPCRASSTASSPAPPSGPSGSPPPSSTSKPATACCSAATAATS